MGKRTALEAGPKARLHIKASVKVLQVQLNSPDVAGPIARTVSPVAAAFGVAPARAGRGRRRQGSLEPRRRRNLAHRGARGGARGGHAHDDLIIIIPLQFDVGDGRRVRSSPAEPKLRTGPYSTGTSAQSSVLGAIAPGAPSAQPAKARSIRRSAPPSATVPLLVRHDDNGSATSPPPRPSWSLHPPGVQREGAV